MNLKERALEYHRKTTGKIETHIKSRVRNRKDLALAYTPGVGEVSKAVANNEVSVNEVTNRRNTVAVVSDGSAVLGLGNIGPEGAMPVMEGKALLFKQFANVDAVPICLATQDVEEIIAIVKNLEPSFGGINLEDISAPRCFEIEERLKKLMNIPVFHDDQHGTAIVVLAALINALKVAHGAQCTVHSAQGKQMRIVINGAGAAGIAIAKILKAYGFANLVLLDSQGIVSASRQDLNEFKKEFAVTQEGVLADAVRGADVFIGLSAPGVLTTEMVRTMNADAIIFAMANPVPEIVPDEALAGGAAVVATGRSDFANQINNVLAFPGIFRGALDAGARDITEDMKLAAAEAIAGLIPDKKLKPDYIIPSAFDKKVMPAVAAAVKRVFEEKL